MQNSYYKISVGYLILLLVILAVFGYTPTNDGDGYIQLAILSLKDGMPYPSPSSIYGQPFVWNIGEICIVEFSLWLFHSVYPVLIANCFLKALTALSVALIAKKLFNDKVGLVAIILYILYPNNWGDSTMLLTETPSIALSLSALYIILSKKHWKMWLLAGLLFATSNWIRPVSPIYIGSALLYHLIFNRKNVIRHYASLASTYVAFTLLIGFGSWSRTGYFLYQADTLWFNMAEATYETSVAPHYNSEMYPKGTIRYIEGREHLTAPECSRIWKKRDLEWLKNNKLAYMKKVPGRLYYMYISDIDNISAFIVNKKNTASNYVTLPYKHIFKEFTALTSVQYLALLTWIMYLFMLASFIVGIASIMHQKLNSQLFILLMIVIGGSLAMVLVNHGETRFKAPMMPFIFMVSAYFLSTTNYLKKND